MINTVTSKYVIKYTKSGDSAPQGTLTPFCVTDEDAINWFNESRWGKTHTIVELRRLTK
jgi:hypothetical protein